MGNGTLKIKLYGPEFANTQSETVLTSEYEKILEIQERMILTMKRCRVKGLAAPQIGIFKEFVVIENRNHKFIGLINPMIERMFGREVEDFETCLCIPPPGNQCRVPRMESVIVEAVTFEKHFSKSHLKFSGNEARMVQQMMDYLTGTFFIDRVAEKKKRNVLSSFNSWKTNWERSGRPFPY